MITPNEGPWTVFWLRKFHNPRSAHLFPDSSSVDAVWVMSLNIGTVSITSDTTARVGTKHVLHVMCSGSAEVTSGHQIILKLSWTYHVHFGVSCSAGMVGIFVVGPCLLLGDNATSESRSSELLGDAFRAWGTAYGLRKTELQRTLGKISGCGWMRHTLPQAQGAHLFIIWYLVHLTVTCVYKSQRLRTYILWHLSLTSSHIT